MCQHDGRKSDFLCPVGTIFNQEIFVCDWWQNFRCQDTPNFYANNDELYKTPVRPAVAAAAPLSNQLRKRTDTVEREEEPPFSDEGREESDSAVEEVAGGSSSEDESSPPPPAPSAAPVAVKGYSDRQTETTLRPAQVVGETKSSRVASYGARVGSGKRSRVDSLTAAASKSKTSVSPNGNWTEAGTGTAAADAVVTLKMSTSALPLPV